MNNKLLKNIIIIIIILTVIVLGLLIFVSRNKEEIKDKDSNSSSINENKVDDGNQINDGLDGEIANPNLLSNSGKVDIYTFLTLSNCVSQYLEALNKNNSSLYGTDKNGKYVKVVSDEEVKKRITSISNNNIQMLDEKRVFIPISALKKIDGVVSTYVIYGATATANMEYIADEYYIVNLDQSNQTFSLEKTNGNSNLQQISVNKVDSINANDYNKYRYPDLNEEYKYKQIFNNIKYLMLIKPEIVYERLDDEYKKERFGSYEYFENFTKQNKKHLMKISFHKSELLEDNITLLIQDQYLTKYQITISDNMDYSNVKIDNYIALLNDDIESYKKYNDKDKIKYNVRRWIKMINSKDYKFAYKYLNETFKANKYPTLENFSKFMESKYTQWYDDITTKVEQDGNTYTVNVELKVSNEEFSDKYMTIIMRLEDDNNFTMSFEPQ